MKDLVTINKNSKLALAKSKNLLNITKNILSKKDLKSVAENFNFKPFLSLGHTGYVYSVAISPDGKYIVSGSNDTTIKIWDMRSGACVYTIYNSSSDYVAINNQGYFHANDEAIEKYLRVSEKPLTVRKLSKEEIKHFRQKDDFLEVGEIIKPKFASFHSIPVIDIDEDEIPF